MSIEQLTPVISSGRRYWFLRTEGGEFYDIFRLDKFVAIGWDEIKADVIEQLANKIDKEEILHKLVIKYYPKKKKQGLITTQIHRFLFEMRKGDIVIIPSYSSKQLLFGEIKDDEVVSSESYDKKREKNYSFEKSRSIRWIKSLSRNEVNPKLYSLFFSHQTISSGDRYALLIDNELEDFYLKDDIAHLVVSINKNEGIQARPFLEFCLELLNLTEEFLKEKNLGDGTENIEFTSNLNSPGKIEFKGNVKAIALVGLLIISLQGGEYSISLTGIKIKPQEGLLDELNKFLDRHDNKKSLEEIKSQLKVKDSENLRKIIGDNPKIII